MADTTNTNNNTTSNNSEFFTDYLEVIGLDQLGLLRDIDLQLKNIARSDGIKLSQSSLKDLMVAEQRNERVIERQKAQRGAYNKNKQNQQQGAGAAYSPNDQRGYRRSSGSFSDDQLFGFDRRSGRIRSGQMWEHVVDDFEDTLLKGLAGTTKNPFDNVFKNLSDQLIKSVGAKGVDDFGQKAGESLLKKLDKIPYTSIFKRKVYGKDGKVLRDENGNIIKGRQQTTIKGELEAEINTLKGAANRVISGGMNSITKNLFGGTGTEFGPNTDWFSDLFNPEASQNETEQVVSHMDKGFGSVVDAIKESRQRSKNEFYDPNDYDPNVIDVPYSMSDADKEPNKPEDYVGQGIEKVKQLIGDKESGGSEETGLSVPGKDILTDTIKKFTGATEGAEKGVVSLVGQFGEVSEVVGTVGAAFPELLVGIGLASVALELISEQVNTVIGPAIEGVKKFFDALKSGFNREITFYSKSIELANKRTEQDIKSLREAAYDVIKDAANRVTEVWDKVESTIAATQLIDKAGVQDLWSAYAQRLKEEGLASVVSSADIMDKLESVLNQGLQGAVAEEFAYQATLLNSAIPTEDFFQYASTYASIAANAIKAGMSQQEAIDFATSELQNFANNLLYASREVAGGFTTTLVSSSELFEKATDISLTAHQSSINEISRILTTVSGAVGAIAPDLASGIVDAIYKAAVGGNSSEITALRSMSGVGAGNTAFLQALIENPQEVLSTLFGNLSQLQNMSSENYMEVAEGLSEIFGMTMKEFARVDFNYLASAISNMSLSSNELQENMEMLVAGQTTSNDSQQRMQKINEYMIEEGLAYVLDNQVARAIQEHMWEEQLARDIMEAEYSVDLIGSSKTMLAGIMNTLKGLIDLVNPLAWVKKIGNVALTLVEAAAEDADIKQVLELGKVGRGNAQELHDLTTRGEWLNLATPIVELLGGVSHQRTVQDLMALSDSIMTMNWGMDMYNTGGGIGAIGDLINQGGNLIEGAGNSVKNGIDSVTNGLSNLTGSSQDASSAMEQYTSSVDSAAAAAVQYQTAQETQAAIQAQAAQQYADASQAVAKARESILETASAAGGVATAVGDVIKNSAAGTWVRGNASGIAEVSKGVIAGDLTALTGTAAAGAEVVKGAAAAGVEVAKGALGTTGELAKGLWDVVTTGSTSNWNSAVESARSTYQSGLDSAKSVLASSQETAKQIGNDAIQEAKSITESSIQKGKDIINNATNTAKQKIQDLVSNPASAIAKSTQSIAEATDKLKESASNTASEIKKAAASLTSSKGILGKTISSLISSGDWRTNAGYNPYYQNFGDSGTDYYTPTANDADTLSELINKSISEYINDETKTAVKLDNERSFITEDNEDRLIERDIEKLLEEGQLEHRSYYTNEDMVKMVQSKLDEISAEEQTTSFEDWLDKFQKETGIGNLSATLSDYGESLSTIEAMYLEQEANRQNALTKARDLHEVQFWEDMQNFATIDFPNFFREWERYYIQHEAYTEASNEAYMEAVNLSVREKGEMGDSVLALAEALTENSIWMQDVGDSIKDPVLHTNVLLSKILLVVEAIMQQNNETSIVSIPTALSSLGLGISNG